VLPRDFLDEVERELRDARRNLTVDGGRVAALQELRRLVLGLVAELGRPVTVFDVVRTAKEDAERARRAGLVRELMRPITNRRRGEDEELD
jgi:hypothetical protein